MKAEDRDVLRELLTEARVLSLGVLVEGEPYVGLLPFVVGHDFQSVLVHASDLAKHSRGLQEGSPFSLLIHGTDEPGGDPLQVARVTISGNGAPGGENGRGVPPSARRLHRSLPDFGAHLHARRFLSLQTAVRARPAGGGFCPRRQPPSGVVCRVELAVTIATWRRPSHRAIRSQTAASGAATMEMAAAPKPRCTSPS